jgi:hypothetical protein
MARADAGRPLQMPISGRPTIDIMNFFSRGLRLDSRFCCAGAKNRVPTRPLWVDAGRTGSWAEEALTKRFRQMQLEIVKSTRWRE